MKKVICSFFAVIFCMMLFVGCGEEKKYTMALEALKQGNIETAKELFSEIDDYQDSAEYIEKMTSTVEGVSDIVYYSINELYQEVSSDEYWEETSSGVISGLDTPEIKTLNDVYAVCPTLPEWESFNNRLERAVPKNASEEELALKNLMKQYWVSKCQLELNEKSTSGSVYFQFWVAAIRFLGGDESVEDEFLNSIVVVIEQDYFKSPNEETLEIMNDGIINQAIQSRTFFKQVWET